MRIFHKDGRCAVVLNLTLPTAEGDEGVHFREYYAGIEDAIYKGAESLVECYDGIPISVIVSFSSEERDDTLVILRSISVKARQKRVVREFCDTFDSIGIPTKRTQKKKARAN